MNSFKGVIGIILAIAGLGTLILWYFTDLINWNVFGWFSWLLVALGYWLASSADKKEE